MKNMVEKIYFKDLKENLKESMGTVELCDYFRIVKLSNGCYQVETENFKRVYITFDDVLNLIRFEIDRLYAVPQGWITGTYLEWLKEIESDILKISA